MVPTFGFSVGDFISAINLIKKVSKALKTAGGASSEYQLVIIELRGLKHVLRQLEALEPTEDNVNHVNAIRGMALACQLPLQEFLRKLETYESSMGSFADRISFRGTHYKTKWAISMAEDVEKLRALIAGKVISINLLLATHSSQTLSKLESRGKREHKDLMTKILEQRHCFTQVEDGLQVVKDQVSQGQSALENRLDAVSATTSNLQTSVMRVRSIGSQLLAFIGTFSAEIRELLQRVIQNDQQMYNLLLQVQRCISTSPTSLLQSNIKFEDALGRARELLYDYFRCWEPFEGFLRAEFKNIPGESKVLDGQYHILDNKRRGALISKESWSQSVFPGAELSMSMIMAFVRRKTGCCPRPSCKGKQILGGDDSTSVTCSDCGLVFYSTSYHLEETFGRVTVLEEEEDVARRQAEEDIQLFGTRPKPQDPEECDEAMQLDLTNQKRKRADSETILGEPSQKKKSREEEWLKTSAASSFTGEAPSDSTHQVLTAIDWNGGETPLNAWLNQSALPSACLPLEEVQQEQALREQEQMSLEGKELEFYRKVHIPTAPEPVAGNPSTMSVDEDEVQELEPGAQIYFRNIIDRFPRIPRYLARRLAEANMARARRLQRLKRQAESHIEGAPAERTDFDLSAVDEEEVKPKTKVELVFKDDGSAEFVRVNVDSDGEEVKEEKIDKLDDDSKPNIEGERPTKSHFSSEISSSIEKEYRCKFCSLRFTQPGFLRRHMYSHPGAKPYSCDVVGCESTEGFDLVGQLQRHRQDIHGFKETADSLPAKHAHDSVRTGTEEVSPALPPLDLSFDLVVPPTPKIKQRLFQDNNTSPYEGVPPPLPPNPMFDQGVSPIRVLKPWAFQDNNTSPYAQNLAIKPNADDQSFWTGEKSTRRIGSVGSRCSSRNSSLRGVPRFDPLEQNPVFSASPRGSVISMYSQTSPGLPPPPVELGKVLTFPCDICGQEVVVKRKREWQQHVYQDLEPYVCTFRDCEYPSKTYGSRTAYIEHVVAIHGPTLFPRSECQFCTEQIDAGRVGWMSHLGSHMETIAFAVVTKPYEDWEFYSDWSSSKSAASNPEIRKRKHIHCDNSPRSKYDQSLLDKLNPARFDPSRRSGSALRPRTPREGDERPIPVVRKHRVPKLQGVHICDCCPKKPKRFDTAEQLRLHKSEKQYICQYCHNRFKNKNEAERHQNIIHLRRHSWSCAALSSHEAAFHPSPFKNSPGGADVCGFCGQEFSTPGNWAARVEHLINVHKFGECNQAKKFFRADHFRQHLKHSHAGTSGKWTNMLENACMKDELPPERQKRYSLDQQGIRTDLVT